MTLGVFLGLWAAVSWGTADFVAQFSARQIGAYRTLFFMQVVGFLSGVLYVAGITGSGGLSTVIRDAGRHWQLTVLLGGTSGLSMLAFYSALERGRLSIVAPISSSYPALTVLLAYGSGERLMPMRLAGVLFALSGVVLASLAEAAPRTANDKSTGIYSTQAASRLAPGVFPAMLCAAGFGVTYWALGFYAIPAWGAVNTVLIQRLSTVVWLMAAVVPLGRSLAPPRGSGWLLVAVVGVLDAFGFLLSNYGFEREQVGVITVLGSMFGAVTLVLAFVFLGERLVRRQWAGVGLIFAGILLINSR